MCSEIRLYQEDDEYKIIDLLELVFGQWPGYDIKCDPVDHWRWKYLENPVNKGLVSLCLDNDKIVGCFHSVPMNIKIGDNIYKSTTGTDLAVHPDYRRIGIYGKMKSVLYTAEKKENILFHFGVSGNPILIERGKREGQRYFPYETYKYVKIKDMNEHVKNWDDVSATKIFGYKTLYTLNVIKRSYSKKEASSEYDIINIDHFSESIDEFWEEVYKQYNFIVEKRKNYLNWRYTSPHCGSYQIIVAYDQNNIKGYAVLKIDRSRPRYSVGYIVDLLTESDGLSTAYQLMKNAIDYFDSEKVNMILWQIITGHPYTQVAEHFNLLNSRSQVYFNYNPDFTIEESDELRLQNCKPGKIHFSYGDYDQI
jgi:hypothetical protein